MQSGFAHMINFATQSRPKGDSLDRALYQYAKLPSAEQQAILAVLHTYEDQIRKTAAPLASKYSAFVTFDELTAEARTAVLGSIVTSDKSRRTSLTRRVTPRIGGAMIDLVRKRFVERGLPRQDADKDIDNAFKIFRGDNNRIPGPEELATLAKVSLERAKNFLDRKNRRITISLNHHNFRIEQPEAKRHRSNSARAARILEQLPSVLTGKRKELWLLLRSEDLRNCEAASRLGISVETVGSYRRSFAVAARRMLKAARLDRVGITAEQLRVKASVELDGKINRAAETVSGEKAKISLNPVVEARRDRVHLSEVTLPETFRPILIELFPELKGPPEQQYLLRDHIRGWQTVLSLVRPVINKLPGWPFMNLREHNAVLFVRDTFARDLHTDPNRLGRIGGIRADANSAALKIYGLYGGAKGTRR